MTGTAVPRNLDERPFWLHGVHPAEPVRFNGTTGTWDVFGREEATHVLANPATFSSDTSSLVPEAEEFNAGNIAAMDPPRHTRLRKLVNRAFTPRVVAGLEPRIRELAGELLDGAGDRTELVDAFAHPLPVIVIAELLGVPSSDRYLFKQWVDAMFEVDTSEFCAEERTEEQQREFRHAIEQVQKLTRYLGEHAAQRRSRPREDLLTRLVEAEVDGERLTDQEVVNFANVLLIAGHITTTLLLGNTVLCLDAHPEAFEAVRADRALVPGAIEESLRFLSPFARLARVAKHGVDLGGRSIPEGAVLNVWLDRFPRLRCDPGNPPVFHRDASMTGVRGLPLLLG